MADNNEWRPRPRGQHWSPARGGGHNKFNSPRYGGGGGGGWHNQQRSPYPYQNQQSPFNAPHFATSTPIHQHPHRGHFRDRPYNFRGGRGGPNRFNSPRSFNQSSEEQGIEAWVHPAMWDDPWKEFSHGSSSFDNTTDAQFGSTTKFASSIDSSYNAMNQTTDLGVSDMILTSGLETPDTSAAPLPDYTLNSSHPTDQTTPDSETTDAAKDLLSLITS